MDFEQFLELHGPLEVVESRSECPILIAEPLIGEPADRIELGNLLGTKGAVLHRQPDLGGLQVAQNFGCSPGVVAGSGLLELILGAGAVLAAVAAAELLEGQ